MSQLNQLIHIAKLNSNTPKAYIAINLETGLHTAIREWAKELRIPIIRLVSAILWDAVQAAGRTAESKTPPD